MNKDKILDEMFEYFEGTRDNFDIDMVEEFLESYEPQETLIQDIHERLTRIENRKEILLSALKSNNEDREELACFFVDTNALDFFSVDEINRLLNSNELKNSPLEKVRGSLIGASGNIEKYLAPEYIKAVGLSDYSVVNLIEKSGNIEKYLAPEYVKAVDMPKWALADLIEKSGNIEKYLAPEYINAVGMGEGYLVQLIEKSGNIEKYLAPEYIKAVGLSDYSVVNLIEKSGNIEKYLAPEYINAVGMDEGHLVQLIEKSGNIEKYLAPEYINAVGMDEELLAHLIKASGNIEKYLAPEYINAVGMKGYLANLIKASGNIEKYLALEYIKAVGMKEGYVADLIEKSGNIEKYLAPEYINAVGITQGLLNHLIKASGNIEKYLAPEYINAVGMDEGHLVQLIEKSGNIEKYLAPEYIKAVGLSDYSVVNLMEKSGNIEKFLAPESVKTHKLTGKSILFILGVKVLDKNVPELDNMIDNDQYTSETAFNLIKICNLIRQSNSGKLNRIASNVLMNILTKPVDGQLDMAKKILKIYETNDIPEFAKDFMVFATLNSAFLEGTESKGNIPSLNRATPTQRKNIIFSDLLRISIESNNRNLREYLNNIEQGDKLFEMFKAGNLQIDSTLPEESRVILKKYCNMLNTMYNQTSRGRRLDNARINSGNLAQDLTELNDLFTNEENIHIPLRDRIVRTFGYWAGIRSFEQAKKMMEENTKEADRRNRETAKKRDFSIRKGDFAKGILRSEYFPTMLQNGIVAKDYLGQSADSDATPLDTDVESVEIDEEMFTASSFTNQDEDGRKLGKIILIIKKDERYVKTRTNNKVDEEAINTVINNKQNIEYFDNLNESNFPNAYGIRTGIASTNINFIVADKYVDKLGLEIAMNGFYIPVVDSDKNLLYTPEMYDNIRSKMQGLSHYGLTEFQLDPSAWNIGISQIAHVIEQSKEDANNKRKLILQTLKSAVETYGLNMSEKMTEDILQGTVEIIDTGSTGRGTNLPGDGDFDFMVRLDNNILTEPERFKQLITDAVCSLDKPNESVNTFKGDFRFKGVSIAGIKEKVDLDLSFTPRTDEIEYTTEECINDRLETIKRSNPEEYKCVVANIILAKTVLKSAGAYKRKNAPAPINGEKDTRGGLGAVGIENWVLQNGGSFEKAARGFLEVSKQCEGLSEFRQRYAIWDFGENYMAGDNYPHDNFVDNMDDNGYSVMVNALEDYIKTIENERKIETQKKGIGDLVQEDMSALNDTPYMMAVAKILESARRMEREELVSK